MQLQEIDAATRRKPFDAWTAAWMLVATIAFFLLFRDIALTRFAGDLSLDGIALWGRDFVNVYTAGSLVIADRLNILYDIGAYQAYQARLFAADLRFHNYSYPPVTLLYAPLFAALPYPVALAAWLGGTGAFFAWAARPYLAGAGLPTWLALALPASLVNAWAGHYGFLVGGLWLAAWNVLDRRPLGAGVLIGLMIVKPHMALLAPFVLLRRRAWGTIAAAAATSAGLVALSVLVFGLEPWRVYLTQTAMLQISLIDDADSMFIRMMPTISPSMVLLTGSNAVATALQVAGGAVAAALLWWRLPADDREAGLATATATFLVLPYAFAYDMTAVCVASVILFRRSMASDPQMSSEPLYAMLAAAMFVTPITLLFLNPHWPVAPILLFFQLLVLLRLPEPGSAPVPHQARA